MAGAVVVTSLTSALVKIACEKLSSAIVPQAKLAWNFSGDLEDMKDTMESMSAVFKDAEKRSVQEESVRLWLKRLKHAAYDISDMMDDYQDTAGTGSTATKMPGVLSRFTSAPKKMMVLANKMKKTRKKLRKINEQCQNFSFTRSAAPAQDQQRYDERETTSAVIEARILGRDVEKKEITDILSASHWKDGTMVLPIYGLGGMGKSTLAQLVYNDTQFKQYDHRVWVYVSEVFDLKKIGRSIISRLPTPRGQQNTDTLELIQQSLNDLLPNKKILIVLDDIWEEDALKLNKLKDMLNVDNGMVDVLVTTRSESIANKICTNEAYKLQPLVHNVCWDIIKRYSGFEDKSNKQTLEEIGLDIAKKCGGVALAAQALGDLLKSKDLDGWSEINNSDIWNESFGVDDLQHKKVLPSLKLSYEHMLPILRLCFSYCAIFRKGHDIYEDDLVHQWMALDFIKKPSEGKEYINHLVGMSFLQHSKKPTIARKNVMCYTMHDLVHDLARSILEDELIVIDVAEKHQINHQTYCRYALIKNYEGQKPLSDILPKKVRALHFSSGSKLGPGDGSFSVPKRLCILDFSECPGIILPSSIGQLKQLKCVIAPELENKSLPDAIGELSKLQYLNLRGSSLISALPESIGKLSCLTYIGLSGCSGIFKIPGSFGGLKSLVHLDVSYCSRITVLPDSLGDLSKLQHLDLPFSGVKELPESLGGLNGLQRLNLSLCRRVTRLPEAIGSLNSLQYLNLSGNKKIRELPGSFQNLQKLLHLDLSSCPCVKGLAEALRGLTSLEHLDMSWIEIDYSSQNDILDAVRNLTNLKYLSISHIQRSSDFFGTLTNLEHLVLLPYESVFLPESIGNLKKLHTLVLSSFQLRSLPDSIGNLTKLHTLNLSACSELKSLPDSIGNLKKLHTLYLSNCSELKSLPNSIGNLKKLHTLNLSECRELKSLPDSISEVTALKSLLIDGCSDELIGQANSKLDYSLTLPLFRVLADVVNACSNLPLLECSNVGELSIRSLENVRSLEEARKVKLWDKFKLSDLQLEWTSLCVERFVDEEDLLGQLLPPRGLKRLGLERYSGQSFPSWFMDISLHLPNLVCITLSFLSKCNTLPPLGQLPNLEELSVMSCYRVTKIGKDFCGGKGAFRRLTRFTMTDMKNLEEWCTTYSVQDGVEEFMFPVLKILFISNCPRLRFTPCVPVCLDSFNIFECNEIISSLEKLGNNNGHVTSSTPTTELVLMGNDSKTLSVFHHFTGLQDVRIMYHDSLTGLPESMRQLTSLQFLELNYCKRISALPEWLGELSSLKRLTIGDCPGIKSLPPCIQQLTNLQTLRVEQGLELKRWCESEENKKKLAHINNIVYESCDYEAPDYSSEGDEEPTNQCSSEGDELAEYSSEGNELREYSSEGDELREYSSTSTSSRTATAHCSSTPHCSRPTSSKARRYLR